MKFDINELAWAIINFVTLLALLSRFFWRPFLKLLEQRRTEIADGLRKAEDAAREAEELHRRYQQHIADAHREAQEVLARARAAAEEAKAQIVGEAQAEAERRTQRALEAIDREKNKALAELRDEVAELAVMAAGRVVGRALSTADHRELVREVVGEVGSRRAG